MTGGRRAQLPAWVYIGLPATPWTEEPRCSKPPPGSASPSVALRHERARMARRTSRLRDPSCRCYCCCYCPAATAPLLLPRCCCCCCCCCSCSCATAALALLRQPRCVLLLTPQPPPQRESPCSFSPSVWHKRGLGASRVGDSYTGSNEPGPRAPEAARPVPVLPGQSHPQKTQGSSSSSSSSSALLLPLPGGRAARGEKPLHHGGLTCSQRPEPLTTCTTPRTAPHPRRPARQSLPSHSRYDERQGGARRVRGGVDCRCIAAQGQLLRHRACEDSGVEDGRHAAATAATALAADAVRPGSPLPCAATV